MRAVAIRRFGDPDGLEVVDLSAPVPAVGELLIEVETVGVGGVDAVIRRRTLASSTFRPGHVLGSEVVGTVAAVGEGVDGSWLGRRVWAFTLVGGYAEQVVARVGNVIVLPVGLSAVDAVTLGSAGPVAHFALERAALTSGEDLLVRGAAGSIGIAAVELAARAGAGSITVTTSSVQRGERLRALGATHVLDRSGAGDTRAPDRFDVILDVVAGPDLTGFLERLAPNGRLVLVGIVGGPPPADLWTTLMGRFQQSPTLAAFSLDTVPRTDLASVRAQQFEDAVRGDLHPVVHDVLPLEAAAEAHRRMDAGEVFGRIVLSTGVGRLL